MPLIHSYWSYWCLWYTGDIQFIYMVQETFKLLISKGSKFERVDFYRKFENLNFVHDASDTLVLIVRLWYRRHSIYNEGIFFYYCTCFHSILLNGYMRCVVYLSKDLSKDIYQRKWNSHQISKNCRATWKLLNRLMTGQATHTLRSYLLNRHVILFHLISKLIKAADYRWKKAIQSKKKLRFCCFAFGGQYFDFLIVNSPFFIHVKNKIF